MDFEFRLYRSGESTAIVDPRFIVSGRFAAEPFTLRSRTSPVPLALASSQCDVRFTVLVDKKIGN
jgi:hypothetical protein